MKFWTGLAALIALLLALPGVAQAKWLRGESAHFIIYSDGGESSLRDYALRLEDLDYAMRLLTGIDPKIPPPVRKLPVFMVRGDTQLKQIWPNVDRNIGGFYIVNSRDIFDVSIKKLTMMVVSADDGSDLIMYHEYAHHFMSQYFGGSYPTWLSEGFAEYFGASTVVDGRIRVGKVPGREIDPRGEWLPLSTLLTKSPFDLPVDKREDYYIAAWALTHYLLSGSAGANALSEYLSGIGAGQDSLVAMQKATGGDMASLQRKILAYISGPLRYNIFDRPKRQASEVAILALPASADALLLERQQLAMMLSPDSRKTLVETIRTDAAKYPGDRFAQLTLARAEIEEGDRLAGEQILAPLLAANSDDPEVNELMGLSKIRMLEKDGAGMTPAQRNQLVEAIQAHLAVPTKADPANYQAMIASSKAARMLPGFPSEPDMLLLLQAHRAAPQLGSLTLDTAVALMNLGYYDEAATMLAPLLTDPHDNSLTGLARRLIDRAHKKQKPQQEDFAS